MVDPATKTSFRRLNWKESSSDFDKIFPQKCWQLNTFIVQATKTSFHRYTSKKSLETIFFRFLNKNVESDKTKLKILPYDQSLLKIILFSLPY